MVVATVGDVGGFVSQELALGAGERAFAQRVKALACTAPLHDLDARKASVQSADFAVYQMAELALHTIDLVTLAMDFDSGASPEQTVAQVALKAAEQAPDRESIEHAQAARWVLENLLNVGSADRGFRAVYGLSGPEGYARHDFDFKLLDEGLDAEGEPFLRASNEAINVLVGALDVDIESAQIAADLRLEVLISRGRLDEAQAAAQAARYRTIQYAEKLRQYLDATSRDVRNVDWIETMPAFLSEALAHIEERYRAENAILINITQARDTADTPARKQQAAMLVSVVRDCLRRHDQLQAALLQAGPRLRAEQDRQAFTQAPSAAVLDLHAQLLLPVLALPLQQAAPVGEVFLSTAAGLTVQRPVRLVDLFERLTTPPTEPQLLGETVTDPDLTPGEEPSPFGDAAYHHLHRLLELESHAPRRLSALLAEARALAPELPLLVVVRVLAQAAEEISAARRHGQPSVLLAVDDGHVLDDPDFAGADLLVARAVLVDTEPASPISDTQVPPHLAGKAGAA